MAKEARSIRRQVLPNGLTVITEQMTHIRSVAIGIWLKSGSRDEDSEWNGISHFIEHMVFKGTKNRSAEEIARSVDSIGGGLDAFTSKELVSYNTKVLDEHLSRAFDVLADLVLHPRFDAADIEKELWMFLIVYNLVRLIILEAAARQRVAVRRISSIRRRAGIPRSPRYSSTRRWTTRSRSISSSTTSASTPSALPAPAASTST